MNLKIINSAHLRFLALFVTNKRILNKTHFTKFSVFLGCNELIAFVSRWQLFCGSMGANSGMFLAMTPKRVSGPIMLDF